MLPRWRKLRCQRFIFPFRNILLNAAQPIQVDGNRRCRSGYAESTSRPPGSRAAAKRRLECGSLARPIVAQGPEPKEDEPAVTTADAKDSNAATPREVGRALCALPQAKAMPISNDPMGCVAERLLVLLVRQGG